MRAHRKYKHNPIQEFGKRENKAGFTIVEVLMAICIFSIGMLAVATMQYSAINVNSSANHLTIRTTYAMDRLEKLMALPYNDPDLADNATADASTDIAIWTTRTDDSAPAGITIRWAVNDNQPIPNAKLIIVTVQEGGKTTNLQTIKSNI